MTYPPKIKQIQLGESSLSIKKKTTTTNNLHILNYFVCPIFTLDNLSTQTIKIKIFKAQFNKFFSHAVMSLILMTTLF